MKLFILMIVLLCLPVLAYAEEGLCFKECYDVRGTIKVHANLRPYIHAENGRLLGIAEKDGKPSWPPAIETLLKDEADFTGKFHVCPTAHEAPGKMKVVCIDSATDLKTKAKTERFTDKIKQLEIFPLRYGVNELKAGGRDVVIVRI